jgi:predicted acetyltransferase
VSDLDIQPARPEDKPALAGMMQLYVHDFSEHWSGMSARELGRNAPFAELGEDGRFPDYPLDAYWREDGRVPLVFRVEGRLAGFALLNKVAHSGLPVDRNMAEFFVVRRHRRGGVGTKAAHEIFTRYPGRWEAAVARRNAGARIFWRNAVLSHSGATDLEELDIDTTDWNGPILRFKIAS